MSMSRSTDEYSVPCLEMFPFFLNKIHAISMMLREGGLEECGGTSTPEYHPVFFPSLGIMIQHDYEIMKL